MPWLTEDCNHWVSSEQAGHELIGTVLGEDRTQTLKHMRELDPEELMIPFIVSHAGRNSRPCCNVDGYVFEQDVYTLFKEGKAKAIPTIVGSNKDEGTGLFGAFAPKTMDALTDAIVPLLGNELFEDWRQVYGVNTDEDVYQGFLNGQRDYIFTWHMRSWARFASEMDPNVYQYYFSHVPPMKEAERFGAYHTAEIMYVFNVVNKMDWATGTDIDLADTISSYWVNFAETGIPNGRGLPDWKRFDSEHEFCLELGDSLEHQSRLLKDGCDLYEKHFDRLRTK
jgi:para-nitrobenzyl esterase